MLLSELLTDVYIVNSKDIGTPIELAYYDDYDWEKGQDYEGQFFASLDWAHMNSSEFIDGEIAEMEVTDLGLTIHVIAPRDEA